MSFRPAKYNITAETKDGASIVYNSLTGARLHLAADVLSRGQLQALEAPEWPSGVPLPPDELVALLQRHQLFVPLDFDELACFEELRGTHRSNPDLRRVSVILTRKCNLGCGYCYQDKSIGDSKPNRERVLSYVRSQVVPGGALQVSWFGGEPTLRLSDIFTMSEELIAKCEESRTDYSASITTNGTLLKSETINALLASRVRHYQISLDGPALVQERRRPSLVGRPTYDSILHSLQMLVELGASVLVKVILDTENYRAVPELIRDLGRRGLLGSLRLAIQHTEAKFASAEYSKRFASLEDFSRAKLELLELLFEHGYEAQQPSLHPEFCAAVSEYSVQLDMAGNFYRCGTEVDNHTGHLNSANDGQDFVNRDYEDLFVRRRFAHDDCETCKVLPICGGGCTIAAEGHVNRDICSFYRTGIKDYLRLVDASESRVRVAEHTGASDSDRV